jgi:DnaJ homolog subfamily C member 19
MAKLVLFAGIALLIYFWWRGKTASSAMTHAEALKLLDLPPEASPDEIRAAHRRLIGRVHPDAGGSAELAGKINAARDLLLKSRVVPPSQ